MQSNANAWLAAHRSCLRCKTHYINGRVRPTEVDTHIYMHYVVENSCKKKTLNDMPYSAFISLVN